MTTDTEKRLAEIRERADKATKGPWTGKVEPQRYHECDDVDLPAFIRTEQGDLLATFPERYTRNMEQANDDDVSFSAHARSDIPFLLAEIGHLQQKCAEYKFTFDLNWKRTREADELWQAATGRADVWPDLGVLIEWLVSEKNNAAKLFEDSLDLIKAADERTLQMTAERDAAWHAGATAMQEKCLAVMAEGTQIAQRAKLTGDSTKTTISNMLTAAIAESFEVAALQIRALSPSTLNKTE